MRLLMILAVVVSSASHARAGYEWRVANESQYSLWKDGRQIGNLRIDDGAYFRMTGPFSWEKDESEPPIPRPETVQRKTEKVNFGVEMKRISPRERFTLNGREVKRHDVLDDLADDAKIPDDSGFNSLTIIGSEAERKRVLDDLDSPQFAAWRKLLVVQDYDPSGKESPMLNCGFKKDGHPTIYLQKPDGEVLARVDKYSGPQVLEKVRECDPNYQPDKDPDPTKPAPLPGLGGLNLTPELLLLGILGVAAAGLGFVLLAKQKGAK